jgi:phage replication-related protein YjqB (UPF0714/DUF867 family)
MRTFKLLPLLALLASAACAPGYSELRRGKDVYGSFQALKAANTEGLDYSREVYARGAAVSVFAIHGGDIETATSRVARHVAGKDFNLYLFNGWHGESGDLHVTSARFDDPDALRLAAGSALGVSIHAQADRGTWICVGGSNTEAARLTVRRLLAAGFSAETPCTRLPGTSPRNIVNRAAAGGVQLELTLRLLERLERNGEELSRFSEAVRLAALESLPKLTQQAIKEETPE